MADGLFGTEWDAARERIGSWDQVLSIESSVLSDGPDAGSRRLRMTNGPLDLEVLPDRGLDLGRLRVDGVPIAWLSPTGFARSSPFDGDGRGWLRSFGGGLLTTCGLRNVGPACDDEGEAHPMHGLVSSLAADVVRRDVVDGELVVEGIVRESVVFGPHLQLRRRISTPIGSRRIRVDDRIVNLGAAPVEPMLLYHLNLGWPLVDEGTRLRSPASEIRPRDAAAAEGLPNASVFPALAASFPEQVFEHVLPDSTRAEVEVTHPRGLTVRIAFDPRVLPGLFQWRVAEPGLAVLGIEPALVPTILGRADARRRGLLRPLAPGEGISTWLEIAVDGRLA